MINIIISKNDGVAVVLARYRCLRNIHIHIKLGITF